MKAYTANNGLLNSTLSSSESNSLLENKSAAWEKISRNYFLVEVLESMLTSSSKDTYSNTRQRP